jgi:tetratricopeptide (TPR) repeat protein
MLETVRQFALELLNASPDRGAVRDRHLVRFVAFTADVERRSREKERGDLNRLVDRELENILAAHAWCDQAPEGPTLGLHLLAPLQRYWPDRAQFELGMRVYREALARGNQDIPSVGRSRSLSSLSDLLYFRGAYADALSTGRRALEMARELGEPIALVRALDSAACAAYAHGDVQEARALCEEYAIAARRWPELDALNSALTYLGEILRSEGDLEGALRIYDELIPVARDRSTPQNMGVTLSNLAMIQASTGDVSGALASLREATDWAVLTASKRILLAVLECTASLAIPSGRMELGARLYGASEQVMQRTGAQREPADARYHEPIRARAESALGPAVFAAAHTAGSALTLDAAFQEARTWLYEVAPAPVRNAAATS